MPFFDYFASSPLANWALLHSGPGAVPFVNAATAYGGVQTALTSAASGTDGLMNTMRQAWPGGLSSQRAQSAFRNHNAWVREQAMVAQVLGTLAETSAELHGIVEGLMPTLGEIVASMAKRAMATSALAASTGTPMALAAGASVAVAEAEYLILRMRAGAAMSTYEAGAIQVVGALLDVPMTPPPPIVVPEGGGSIPVSLDTRGPLTDLMNNGPNSDILADHPTQPPGDTTHTPGDTTQPGGGDGDPGSDLGQTQPTPDQQAINEIDQALGNEPAFDTGPDGYGLDSSNPDQLFGTSPNSSTLAGLGAGGIGAGMGGLAALGMARGGAGTMPGAATGFRLPGGWTPGSGTPFGATTGAPSGAPVRNAPRRVSAPTARMRRRRKEEEEKTGKVFTPGEQFEVPVLERPPAIGVIEYQDEEPDAELLVDSSLVGVLDRLDDEVEQDNRENSR